MRSQSSCRESGRCFELDVEDRLVRLENHSRVHLEVLVQVQPSSVGAPFVIKAIDQPPSGLVRRKRNVGLILRQQLVVYSDVAVWSSTDHDFLSREVLLVVVDLACRRPSKNFEL